MIKVAVINILKRMNEQGKSFRAISRETGHHRETVKKYVSGEVAPKYKRTRNYNSPIRDLVEPILREWYKSDLAGPKKQRRTAKKMYDDLLAAYDFTGGESTIRCILREIKAQHKEVFVPRAVTPGEYIEFDFGCVHAYYKGEEVKLALHGYQLICSNDIFAYLSERSTQEEMFHSHELAFKHFEGMSEKIRYDNLSLAVKRVLGGGLREENEAFITFKNQFGFESDFCEVGKGWQKGDV